MQEVTKKLKREVDWWPSHSLWTYLEMGRYVKVTSLNYEEDLSQALILQSYWLNFSSTITGNLEKNCFYLTDDCCEMMMQLL